ncbi:hypothetical protein G6O67_001061 [Ophiocordyceps sinensis]|uniref:Uncharacterized protein n=1 Tax=Ophiocordyceps sinensis TaxID=72228 RepID=A0A8H4PWP2_9HYPO|nr:hypothetical protein G6O67_001061 [Ophiocordyceps sinensis]
MSFGTRELHKTLGPRMRPRTCTVSVDGVDCQRKILPEKGTVLYRSNLFRLPLLNSHPRLMTSLHCSNKVINLHGHVALDIGFVNR